jgi:uncharacterized membrane protein
MGKLLTSHYEPAAIVVWQLGVAAVLLSPSLAGASLHQIGRGFPLLLVLGMVYSGLLGIVFFHAVRALPTQELGVLFYLEPASAVLYAWWWLSEKPTALTLVGGVLIVLAGIGIIVADRKVGAPGALSEPVMQEPHSDRASRDLGRARDGARRRDVGRERVGIAASRCSAELAGTRPTPGARQGSDQYVDRTRRVRVGSGVVHNARALSARSSERAHNSVEQYPDAGRKQGRLKLVEAKSERMLRELIRDALCRIRYLTEE